MPQGYYGTEDNPLAELHSERRIITPQSGGGSLEEGRYRLRTDLNSGDRIATYEVNVGNGVEEAPVFPVSMSAGAEIEKVRQTFIPGEGWGFVPLLDAGARFSELQYHHDGTWYGWHDSLTAFPSEITNHWRHDEGSGTTLGDDIGSVNGSISGASWVTGSGGLEDAYLSYDGTGDVTTLADASQFDSDTFSWWGWINPDSLSEEHGLISVTNGNDDIIVLIYITSSGDLEYFINNAAGDGNRSITTGSVQTSTWNFFAAVGDNGNRMGFYHALQSDADVTQIEVKTYDQGLNSTANEIRLGEREDGTSNYAGDMDDVAYAAGGTLSQSEIEDWFDRTKGNYS